MDVRTGDSIGVLPGEQYAALAARLKGTLVLPGQGEWERARRPWQLLVDQQPAAVVEALDAADVVETVVAARRLGLGVAPQGTGHAAGALGALGDVILLRTQGLDEIEIDAVEKTARVGAGALWADVIARAAEHGLTAVAGMAPGVGVTGFLLGGGLGWLARSHGLGADSILSMEVVDARGRVLTVDPQQNGELLWAARGGMLPAIVTSVRIRLHEVPSLHAGALMWPLDRAVEVAHAWREWIATVPDTVTSLVRVLRFPPLPEIPEPLRGRSFVAVEATVQADPEAASSLLAPLRSLAPEADSFRDLGPTELGAVHGDPVDPAPALGESVLLAEITADAVDAMLDVVLGPLGSSLVSVELRHLGGALRPGGRAGALAGIEGEGLVYAVGIVPVPELAEPVRAATEALVAGMAEFASCRQVKTFAERPARADALYGDAADRIRQLASEWDGEGLIRLGHALGAVSPATGVHEPGSGLEG